MKTEKIEAVKNLNEVGEKVFRTAMELKNMFSSGRAQEQEARSLIEELKDLDPDPEVGHIKEASSWARDLLNKCLRTLIYVSSEKL